MAWGLANLFGYKRKRGLESDAHNEIQIDQGAAKKKGVVQAANNKKSDTATVRTAKGIKSTKRANGRKKVAFKPDARLTRSQLERLREEEDDTDDNQRQQQLGSEETRKANRNYPPPRTQGTGQKSGSARTGQQSKGGDGKPPGKRRRTQPSQGAPSSLRSREPAAATNHTSAAVKEKEKNSSDAAGRVRMGKQKTGRKGGRHKAQPVKEDVPGPSNHQPDPVVEPPAPGGNELRTGGLKRVRSSWKLRPLFIDEKLRIFIEGRDDELLHYDGGEFYAWLQDCQAGEVHPDDCFPLVVQDQDLRTLLEIKPQSDVAKQQQDAIGHVAKEAPIWVPVIKELPLEEQPDVMLEREPEAAAATPASLAEDRQAGSPGGMWGGGSGAAAGVMVAEGEIDDDPISTHDPPYLRYLDPTPDDLDLQVEYDLDEEDEEWLEGYNEKARKGKSRKARRLLSEEWLERLMDRMEKEYTHALQKNPEKWVVTQPGQGSGSDVPIVKLPPIEEVFPLEACMAAPGMHHYPNIIEAVYGYWKGKHTRAGSPLIQRLWYEPPWHRKKAAERLAEDEEGGGGPFLAQDLAPALQHVRRRRLDHGEIRSRFGEVRRDLDAARLLADQVRRREKLKKQELRLFQQEWAARMSEVQAGNPQLVRNGQLRNPPPPLSAVDRLRAAGGGAADGQPPGVGVGGGEGQDGGDGAAAEDRATRLAARRSARDAATLTGLKKRARKTGGPIGRPRKTGGRAGRPPISKPAPEKQQRGTGKPAGRRHIVHQLEVDRNGLDPGRGKDAPGIGPQGEKQHMECMWCGGSRGPRLECSACPRVYCRDCYKGTPGLGLRAWKQASKNPEYKCLVCAEAEEADRSDNTTVELADEAEEFAECSQPPQQRQRGGRQESGDLALDTQPGKQQRARGRRAEGKGGELSGQAHEEQADRQGAPSVRRAKQQQKTATKVAVGSDHQQGPRRSRAVAEEGPTAARHATSSRGGRGRAVLKENQAPSAATSDADAVRPAKRTKPKQAALHGMAAEGAGGRQQLSTRPERQDATGGEELAGRGRGNRSSSRKALVAVGSAHPLKEANSKRRHSKDDSRAVVGGGLRPKGTGSRAVVASGAGKGGKGAAVRKQVSKRGTRKVVSPRLNREVLALLAQTIHDVTPEKEKGSGSRNAK